MTETDTSGTDDTEHAPDVVVFWRPGCGFCMQLERTLGNSGVQYVRRNIWEDEEAAAFVRSVNNGNETVPTVVIGSEVYTNPPAAAVLAKLSMEAPPGPLRRLFGG
jgi:mycoredoxin